MANNKLPKHEPEVLLAANRAIHNFAPPLETFDNPTRAKNPQIDFANLQIRAVRLHLDMQSKIAARANFEHIRQISNLLSAQIEHSAADVNAITSHFAHMRSISSLPSSQLDRVAMQVNAIPTDFEYINLLPNFPLTQIEPQAAKRKYPEHMYVDMPSATRAVSISVIALCAFSLVMSISTKFTLIDPLAALFAIIGAVGFFAMGAVAKRNARNSEST